MCLSFRDLEDQVEKLRERLTEASEGENWGRSEQEDATECQYQVTMVVTVLMVIVRVRMVVRVKSVNHSPGTRMSILHPKSPHPPTLSLWVRNKQKYHNIDQHRCLKLLTRST